MITALHALLYSEDPPVTRAFFRDVLGWPYLEDANSEPGWLIFRSGPSELGVHPNSWTYGGESTTVPIHHVVSLMCDDMAATLRELSAKGASSSLAYASAISTETSISEFLAYVKITPLTGGTSP